MTATFPFRFWIFLKNTSKRHWLTDFLFIWNNKDYITLISSVSDKVFYYHTLNSQILANTKAKDYYVEVTLWNVSKVFGNVWVDDLKFKVRRINSGDILTRIFCDYLSDKSAYIYILNYYRPLISKEAGMSLPLYFVPHLILCLYNWPLPTIWIVYF